MSQFTQFHGNKLVRMNIQTEKNLKIFEISGRNSLLNFYVEIVHNIYSTLYNIEVSRNLVAIT